MDSNGKKSKLPAIITAVGVTLAVLLCLCALPFKKETKKGDLTIITKAPLIPWYQDKEIHQELEVEEPSNAPIVGSWDFPKEIVETIHYCKFRFDGTPIPLTAAWPFRSERHEFPLLTA